MKTLLLYLMVSCLTSSLLAGATTLKGGVATWSPGQHWQVPAETEDHWYRIPAWLAGTWHTEEGQSYKDPNYRILTGAETARFETTYGHQIDKFGSIWHVFRLPLTKDIELANGHRHLVTTMYEIVDTQPNEVYLIYRATSVSEKDATIYDTSVIDVVGKQRRIDDRRIEYSNDQRFANGVHEYWRCVSTKTAPFIPVDFDKDGHDLRASLASYLTAHGMADRIP